MSEWKEAGKRIEPSIPLPIEEQLIRAGYTVYVSDHGNVLYRQERPPTTDAPRSESAGTQN